VIKVVMALRRRDDVAPEEFHRYWREEHGPLACRLLEPLSLRRYVQTHTLDTDLNAQLAARAARVKFSTASPSCGGNRSTI
jgi:EthD domain